MKPNLVFRLLSLYSLALLSLASCEKTESNPEPNVNECQLDEISTDYGMVVTYKYNAKGFISEKRNIYNDAPEKTKTTAYSYDEADRLIKEEFSSKDDNYYIIYKYANGILSGADYYGGWRGDYSTRFSYDAEGRIFKIKYDNGEEVTHTYDSDGNVTKSASHFNGNLRALLEWGDYDDKERDIAAIKGYVSTDESKNNPGYMIYTSYVAGEVVYRNEIKYTYQYNSNNLPVSLLATFESGGVDEFTYSYNCELNN